jgi:hypothetical protein
MMALVFTLNVVLMDASGQPNGQYNQYIKTSEGSG